jgi:DNA polymerase I
MSPPLLVIDADSFAHRSYHALPKTIRRRGNKGAGAIVGFANFLLRLYETEKPRAVLVGWDTLDEPTYRNEALESYQGGREFDDELVDQLEVLLEFVAACGFANAKAAGYEADDFLAAAVAKGERSGPVLVASSDRDAYQLASAKTTILQPIKAGEMVRIGPAGVRERYGVDPSQVPDFIALRGDASDRIPGAKGVGPRTAAGLLVKYGSLEKLLAAGRFASQAKDLRLYRSIATMDKSASRNVARNASITGRTRERGAAIHGGRTKHFGTGPGKINSQTSGRRPSSWIRRLVRSTSPMCARRTVWSSSSSTLI